ncbi:kinase-like domain-containing protein [Tanacetum coccineum]
MLKIMLPQSSVNLQSRSILLDDDMVVHVGDFGLARLLGTDLKQNSSTGVKGTIGYAPPEYGMGNDMTSTGDVYSFGILLLELMTGKKPTNDMFNEGLSIHTFASMALPDHVTNVIDGDAIVLQSKEVNAKKVEECLATTIKIGVSCSVDSPPERMKIDIVVNELQCGVIRKGGMNMPKRGFGLGGKIGEDIHCFKFTRMFLEEFDEVEKYVGGLPKMIQGSVMASKPKTMQDAIEFATELMD